MSWRWYHRDDFYPRSQPPRAVKGGIKAQSKAGSFGENWWAKRWIGVLGTFNIGARLGRGRSYARRGQVQSIEVEKGQVKAKVQGSRPTPYQVIIQVKGLSATDWKRLAKVFSSRALFAAKLLAGELPQDIENVFEELKLSLFPDRLDDLKTECSCPDWSNPCKHIAAVYYLLGEEFDRDPFLILKLRGLSREELVDLVGGAGEKGSRRKGPHKNTALTPTEEASPALPPLSSDVTGFWRGGALPEGLFGEVHAPPVAAALLNRLGNFPFWRGEERFFDALKPLYSQASASGIELFLGQRKVR